MNRSMDHPPGKYELWRRMLLVTGCALAVWFFTYASMTPLAAVQIMDFQQLQENETSGPFVSELQRHLALLPIEEYVTHYTENGLIQTQGQEWETFSAHLQATNQGTPPEGWGERIRQENLDSSQAITVFFHLDENPVAEVLRQHQNLASPVYLSHDLSGETLYFRITPLTFTHRSFSFGGGYRPWDYPPDAMIRTGRLPGILFLAIALLAYTLLPRPRHRPESITYAFRYPILLDLVGLIIFLFFFSLPILVSGGSLQALADAPLLTLLFWSISCLSLWFFYTSAWYTSFAMAIEKESLIMTSYRGVVQIPLHEFQLFQPLEKRNPAWLKWLTLLALLSSRGSARTVMMGNALLSLDAVGHGLRLHRKDGRLLDLLFYDQWGGELFSGTDGFTDSLSQASIPWQDELAVNQSLPTLPGGRGTWSAAPVFLSLGALLSVLAVTIAATTLVSAREAVFFQETMPPARAEEPGIVDESEDIHPLKKIPLFGEVHIDGLAPRWVSFFGGEKTDRGTTLALMPDNQVAMGGTSNSPDRIRTAHYLVVADGEGSLVWENRYPHSGRDVIATGLVITEDGGFALAGTAWTYADQDACLIRLDSQGNLLWERLFTGDERSSATHVLAAPEGGFWLAGNRGGYGYVLKTDSQGETNWHTVLAEAGEGSSIHQLVPDGDTGFWAVGSVDHSEDAYTQVYVAYVDQAGTVLWEESYGGEGDHHGYAGVQVEDDTLAIAGSGRLAGGLNRSVILLQISRDGELLQNQSFGIPDHDTTGIAAATHPDGRLALLVDVSAPGPSYVMTLLATTDLSGRVETATHLWTEEPLRGNTMLVDPAGEIFITGITYSTRAFDNNQAFLVKKSWPGE